MWGLSQWESVAVIGASMVSLAPLYFKVVRPAVLTVRSHMRMIASLPSINESLEQLVAEMRTNGGGSLRDAVNRIEQVQEINRQLIQAVYVHGYFRTDESGLVVECSRSLCRTYGRTESELMGNSWCSWIVAGDRERVRDEWFSAVTQQRDFDEQFGIKLPDDGIIMVRARAGTLTSRGGAYLGHLAIFVAT